MDEARYQQSVFLRSRSVFSLVQVLLHRHVPHRNGPSGLGRHLLQRLQDAPSYRPHYLQVRRI